MTVVELVLDVVANVDEAGIMTEVRLLNTGGFEDGLVLDTI